MSDFEPVTCKNAVAGSFYYGAVHCKQGQGVVE